ncbi:GntR family transcriptional regulator [[Clostridium] symbiosum]|uniref:GntR family transcriptional regulator n=1 Tax=Clostridium symbiosum TaxID=1512 RepID=UPI001D08BE6D|nr:GntR family transcriptional regulator [[Clostridium] symbiosum]MCB6610136.1 GntR family transcriptional regulator [[Clostridium] symbiosum]MCB6930558.1 GntR family transcriptional regulator [[Clostridium] symbiosum]
MKTQSSASLTEPVYDHILNLILNMELKPGDRIPEVAIAQELGVSRTPVRNALKQLENEGLVVIYPNRFVQVATYDDEMIQNLGIMRIAVDSMAVRLAIFRGSNEDFHRLRTLAEKCCMIDENAGRLERIRNDYLFHLQLSIIARNPVLEKYQSQFLRQMEVMLSYRFVEAMTASVTHLMIADAIEARDEELAVRLTATHLAEFYHLKENFPFLLKNTQLL